MADDNWLKNFGFNAVRLPRRHLNPNDMLFRDNGRFDTKVGIVSMVVSNDDPGSRDDDGRAVRGDQAAGHERAGGQVRLPAARQLIGAGAGKLGMDTGYKRAHTLDVTYEGRGP